jgi:hypothetical protein
MERGELRSGSRFAARNFNYYTTVKELLEHHKKLLDHHPAITTRATRIAGLNFGSLLQTTVRFRFDSSIIRSTLRAVFFNLFREHTQGAESGFEVVVTFNAILTSEKEKTFSLFYGHDHRADNRSGAAPELKYGATTVVRLLADVDTIPMSFEQQNLIDSHRRAFEDSSIKIHEFINIVYLIYRFVDTASTVTERRGGGKKRDGESAATNLAEGGSLSKKRSGPHPR